MRLFFAQLFVSERKQIAIMADDKSPARISHRLFAMTRSEKRINMIKGHINDYRIVYVAFFDLPGKFVEIVMVSQKSSARIALRRGRKCCYSNPPQAENVASGILYS